MGKTLGIGHLHCLSAKQSCGAIAPTLIPKCISRRNAVRNFQPNVARKNRAGLPVGSNICTIILQILGFKKSLHFSVEGVSTHPEQSGRLELIAPTPLQHFDNQTFFDLVHDKRVNSCHIIVHQVLHQHIDGIPDVRFKNLAGLPLARAVLQSPWSRARLRFVRFHVIQTIQCRPYAWSAS